MLISDFRHFTTAITSCVKVFLVYLYVIIHIITIFKGTAMKHIETIKKKRDRLIQKLTTYNEVVSGNLTKGAVPPGSGKFYWRITWKENQKSKILYVRPEELTMLRKGINQFSQMKKTIKQI
jgi:hypothetical protein